MHQKCTAYKNAFGNTIHLHKQLQPLHCPETAMQVNKFTIVIYLANIGFYFCKFCSSSSSF